MPGGTQQCKTKKGFLRHAFFFTFGAKKQIAHSPQKRKFWTALISITNSLKPNDSTYRSCNISLCYCLKYNVFKLNIWYNNKNILDKIAHSPQFCPTLISIADNLKPNDSTYRSLLLFKIQTEPKNERSCLVVRPNNDQLMASFDCCAR